MAAWTDPYTIDGMAVDFDRREIALSIIQVNAWDEAAFRKLDAKTRYYTTIMTSRRLEEGYPPIAGFHYVFEIVGDQKHSGADLARLAALRAELEKAPVTLRWGAKSKAK